MKVDLHNHLGVNGKNPGFDETINIVHKRLGNNSAFGICNDGYSDFRYENFANQKGGKYSRNWIDREKRILYVPEKMLYVMGVEEVESKQGHFLVAGMPANKKIQKTNKTLSLEDALKSADEINGINIVAHPFGRDGLGPYLMGNFYLTKNFDGWEVYNASAELAIPGVLPFNANKESAEFYNNYLRNKINIGACAFTDGHSVEVIGRSYTGYSGIYHSNLFDDLKNRIRNNKDFRNLHTDPAKLDALKHSYNMAKHMVFKSGA